VHELPRPLRRVIAATLAYFDLPEAGLALILAVDHILDMGRSATNVVGNAVASAVVARWEGQLEAPDPNADEWPPAPSSGHHPPDAHDQFNEPGPSSQA